MSADPQALPMSSEQKLMQMFEAMVLAAHPSANIVRFAESDRPHLMSHMKVGEYANPHIRAMYDGFKLGRQSLAAEVPIQAIELALEFIRASGYIKTRQELESFLKTIAEAKEDAR